MSEPILSSLNHLLNWTSTKAIWAKKFPNQAAAMDQSRVLVSGGHGMNNKVKEKARKEEVSKCSTAGDDDIDDLAEAFIKNFRNQLKVQREESLKHFHKMIARGV